MQFFKKTNFDFLGPRKVLYALSFAVIVAGMISLAVKGIDFGIDFRGGTEVLIEFDQRPAIGDIRDALATVGLAQSEIKVYGLGETILVRTVEQAEGTAVGDRIKSALTRAFPEKRMEVLKQYKISPKIGKELRTDALYAVAASLVVMLGYIGIRFKFVYGFGAVIAVFHDVLVALSALTLLDGLIPWFNFEITQEVVAAFLTLVGISVNDTVVVFDRIRENLKIYRTMSLLEVMNRSLNDTLSRTLITQGTVLLVLLVLLFAGGEVTRGFAFTLTMGTIAGTYSSIYIASAIVLDWNLRKAKKGIRTK
ncbi:MAG: protein-export membrane protein SecF [Bacteroidia bacterium]|nr:MAG: protein-export membrane protein SecF [Bacteroidia bacterium]